MRLCCGAYKTTPVSALQVEVGEMPLYLRRKQLLMNCWANLQGHSEQHPAKKAFLLCWEKEKARQECFAWGSERLAEEIKLAQKRYCLTVPLPVYPMVVSIGGSSFLFFGNNECL